MSALRSALPLRFVGLVPGLVLTFAIAVVAIVGGQSAWMLSHGISPLTLAIVVGMILGNLIPATVVAPCSPGIAFSQKRLLRLGIILYGFRLTFADVAQVGPAAVLIDAIVLSSTFGIACFLGTRVFGLDKTTSMLIGSGSAICGAAAVLATQPVVRGRSDQVAVAVCTVVVFGTIGMFLYPALYQMVADAGWLSAKQYGVYAGSTIHEVAQVVAAGRAVSEHAADTAVIAKMVRVMMLAPFLVLLSMWVARSDRAQGNADAPTFSLAALPWFALGFVAITAFNSTVSIPAEVKRLLIDFDTLMLAMAMAALGMTTHLSAIRRAGMKPLMLASALFAWLLIGGFAINMIVTRLL